MRWRLKSRLLVDHLLEDVDARIVQGVSQEDLPQVRLIFEGAFEGHGGGGSWKIITDAVDWTISFKALDGERIVGVYALGNRQLTVENALDGTTVDAKTLEALQRGCAPFVGRRGVEGVALTVVPEYRSQSIGRKLMDAPRSLGTDYIWGCQLKSLNNLGSWLKRRYLVADTPDFYVTAEDYKRPRMESAFDSVEAVIGA